jgi:hypothetical protein
MLQSVDEQHMSLDRLREASALVEMRMEEGRAATLMMRLRATMRVEERMVECSG